MLKEIPFTRVVERVSDSERICSRRDWRMRDGDGRGEVEVCVAEFEVALDIYQRSGFLSIPLPNFNIVYCIHNLPQLSP